MVMCIVVCTYFESRHILRHRYMLHEDILAGFFILVYTRPGIVTNNFSNDNATVKNY